MREFGESVTLQQIRTFCEVVRRGGFTEAARGLTISTSAVWTSVRSLEKHYGISLLRREGRSVLPTPQGIRLYEMLSPLLVGLDSTREVVRQETGLTPKSLTIATGFRMIMEEISEALAVFQRQQAEIQLRLLQTGSDEVPSLITSEKADLALTLEPDPGDRSPLLSYEPAYANEFMLVIPKRHPLAKKAAIELRDLVNRPLVLGSEKSLRRRIDEMFHMHDLREQMNVRVETGNAAATIACVRAGMGAGIITGRTGGKLTQGLVEHSLKHLFGGARIVFAFKRGMWKPPVIERLIAVIREQTR